MLMKTYKLFFVILLVGMLYSCDKTGQEIIIPPHYQYKISINENCEIWGIQNPAQNIDWLRDMIEYYQNSGRIFFDHHKMIYSVTEMYYETDSIEEVIELHGYTDDDGVYRYIFRQFQHYCLYYYESMENIEEKKALEQFYQNECRRIDTICSMELLDHNSIIPYDTCP